MWILRRGLWVGIARGWGRLRSGCFSHLSIYLAFCLFVCLYSMGFCCGWWWGVVVSGGCLCLPCGWS